MSARPVVRQKLRAHLNTVCSDAKYSEEGNIDKRVRVVNKKILVFVSILGQSVGLRSLASLHAELIPMLADDKSASIKFKFNTKFVGRR